MYSTCLFCKTDLGANEAIEHFAVGRRLAFDAAKGRLWVVCRKCERWNLTPVEERWEAIEECERAYRGTKLRASTDQIGLARLSEGIELVRIGQPLRPEFAAWRYGDQFGRRRRKQLVKTGAVVAGIAVLVPFGPVASVFLGAAGFNAITLLNLSIHLQRRMRILARIPNPGGEPILLRQSDIESAIMLPAVGREPWGLALQHHVSRDVKIPWWSYDKQIEVTAIRGEQALRIAAQLLPHMNADAAASSNVKDAVALIEEYRDPAVIFNAAARTAQSPVWYSNDSTTQGRMVSLAPPLRLALEMVSHEDSERRALEGELHILEAAWKEAEEIAGISDDLFLPSEISTRLDELKRDAK
ncbi:MAG: hypothetical protein JWL97_1779 [Gemmatimonadales bacterium]|nr:hypothetical protein [Gemmatimonadales bacterium]